ncbi:MAG: D-glucuronyl C5-epimerase family protein [Bacteroidia bacterium]|nr:D-glucuronyl C5-epimerase family protein [Bacteroidia bacterium]
MYNREFDSTGILKQKKEYHALSIAIWGIMNYHDYRETGNVKSRQHVINQYRYFNDTSFVHISKDGVYMGLPYKFKFHDLKVPWYSGMTQGVALSYLYRYYDLTKDKTALTKMKQVARFMIRMQDKGGTIGKTPEGYLWIEEYPNSKSSPQVLNGFINGLLGLAEYLEVFPADTAARRIHDSAYKALVATVHKYDTPLWTNYNRNNSGVTNDYMRYEITQMEHLFYYYHDSVFYRQKMIWGPMAVNKFDNRHTFYKAPKFQYAIPLDSSKVNGRLTVKPILEDSICGIPKGITAGKKHYPRTDSLDIVFRKKAGHTLSWENETRFICLRFDTLYATLPKVLVKNDNEKWRPAKVRIQNGRLFVESEKHFTSLLFKPGKQKYRLRYAGCLRHNYAVPEFLFYKYKTTHYLDSSQNYRISCHTENVAQAIVFYRYAVKKETLVTTIWKQYQCVELNSTFTPPAEGYYEFYICFPYYFASPAVSEFKVEKS